MWKKVNGFENHYLINENGEIYSLYKNRLLKPKRNSKNGYEYVSLRGEKTKYCPVHRLVALHFVPGYKPGLCVNHKDEIKTNNRASNLEWCSKAYNNSYNGKNQRCCKEILQFTMDGVLLKKWTSARSVFETLGIQFKNISAVCRGKRKSAGGYIWRFA